MNMYMLTEKEEILHDRKLVMGLNVYDGPFTSICFVRNGFRIYESIRPEYIEENLDHYWIRKVVIPSDATVITRRGKTRCNMAIVGDRIRIGIDHFPGKLADVLTLWPNSIRYCHVSTETEDCWIIALFDKSDLIKYADFPTKTMQCVAVAANCDNYKHIVDPDELLLLYFSNYSKTKNGEY